jgi:hypothetical protein
MTDKKEYQRKYLKKWYQKNKDKVIKRQKEYRENNAEAISIRRKAYYQANKERLKKIHAEYRKNNREAINAKRRAKKLEPLKD